jgi:hypothetical protein
LEALLPAGLPDEGVLAGWLLVAFFTAGLPPCFPEGFSVVLGAVVAGFPSVATGPVNYFSLTYYD